MRLRDPIQGRDPGSRRRDLSRDDNLLFRSEEGRPKDEISEKQGYTLQMKIVGFKCSFLIAGLPSGTYKPKTFLGRLDH